MLFGFDADGIRPTDAVGKGCLLIGAEFAQVDAVRVLAEDGRGPTLASVRFRSAFCCLAQAATEAK